MTPTAPDTYDRRTSSKKRDRTASQLASRLTRAGILRVTSQRHRTQAANKKAALERFGKLIADALSEDPERRPTRVLKAARRRRLDAKRRPSPVKRERRTPLPPED